VAVLLRQVSRYPRPNRCRYGSSSGQARMKRQPCVRRQTKTYQRRAHERLAANSLPGRVDRGRKPVHWLPRAAAASPLVPVARGTALWQRFFTTGRETLSKQGSAEYFSVLIPPVPACAPGAHVLARLRLDSCLTCRRNTSALVVFASLVCGAGRRPFLCSAARAAARERAHWLVGERHGH
jgi:hypothetical protein